MKIRGIIISIFLLLLIGFFLEYKRKYYDLPKVVWTHWNTENPPIEIKKCIERMQKMLPDWKVNFITTEKYIQSLPEGEVPSSFGNYSVEHQSDWIRLHLLKNNGGCWIDSGVILNESINPLWQDCVRNQADLLVFKNKHHQTNEKYPVAENWFILAPMHSQFIQSWFEEYNEAMLTGFKRYKNKIKKEGVDLQNLLKDEDEVYLTQHGCFQKVIQQKLPFSKIVYHIAEDTMFRVQSKDCNWDRECIKQKLQDVNYCRKIPYIKLTGADRKSVDIMPLLL